MKKVKVEGVGHGSGFNDYHTSFEFELSDEHGYSDAEIFLKAKRRLQVKTACHSVTVKKIEVHLCFTNSLN